MFLVSEVHPFDDGNGRLARIMMNAELVAAAQAKILIPTVFREDYLLALKRLTNKNDPEVFIKMLQKAYEFSENVYGENMEEVQHYLQKCNAFYEHTEGRLLRIIKNHNLA